MKKYNSFINYFLLDYIILIAYNNVPEFKNLISNLPYSNFNLVGLDDPAIIQGYLKAIDSLPMQDLLPAITTDYLVNGAFVGSLNWDKTANKFTCLLPHNLDNCDIYNVDLFGFEPVIDLELSEDLQSILDKKEDPRIRRILDRLPSYIKEANGGGKIELNPLTTMYIPRRGRSTDTMGSSYFNRILTIHLVEKALIKGTIESAQRRQRAIMHIAAGIQDSWEPTNEELNELANYFLAADLDPISGIVVTRNGVQISDVKQGHDFWAWDELFDFAVKAKLNALGVNESILSGDASFNTLEASISLFMDNISSTRDMIVQQVFYNKLFPIVAYQNNYLADKKQTNQVLSSANITNPRIRMIGKNKVIGASYDKHSTLYEIGDLTQYAIPTVQFTKQLKPKADKDYMDILNALEEKGIPISMRMYAAAGGENIDDLVASMDDDNELRLEIADRKKELIDDAVEDNVEKYLGIENIDELLPQQDNMNDGSAFAAIKSYANLNKGIVDTKKKFRNLAHLDEIYGVREYDSEGHRRILTLEQKKKLENKIHKQMADALSKTIK